MVKGKSLSIYLLSFIFAVSCSLIFCKSGIAKGLEHMAQNISPQSFYDTNTFYSDAVKIGKPIAIDFYTDWCPHCQTFAPILCDIKKQYENKYTFVTVNGENPENTQLMREFNVTSYPSFFLVNPKTNQKVMVDQYLYTDPNALKGELDKFYNVNK